jgi:hypothetical protein
MARVIVFYGEQLHSTYPTTTEYWDASDNGEIPDGAYRYLPEYQEWMHIGGSGRPADEDVPPLLRAMALMLGD